jgi:hypothetical protein
MLQAITDRNPLALLQTLKEEGNGSDAGAADRAAALHVAAEIGWDLGICLLLRHNTQAGLKEKVRGRTPLHSAIANKHLLSAILMIKAGALQNVFRPPIHGDSSRIDSRCAIDNVLDSTKCTPIDLLSQTLRCNDDTSARCYRWSNRTSVFVSGKADFPLGVPLPRSKYVVTKALEAPALSELQVQTIILATHSSAALTADGRVFTWGHGRFGRLGHGNELSLMEPTVIASLLRHRISSLAAGDNHMLAVCRDTGTLFSWGDNQFGQLGYQEGRSLHTHVDSPREVTYFKKIKGAVVTHVAAGSQHSICALELASTDRNSGFYLTSAPSSSFQIYSWGTNRSGQLGVDLSAGGGQSASPAGHTWTPRAVKLSVKASAGAPTIAYAAVVRVSRLCASHDTSIAVFDIVEGPFLSNQEVLQWGNGQPSPVRVVPSSGRALSERDETRRHWTVVGHSRSACFRGVVIADICCSADRTALVTAEGYVYVWGHPALKVAAPRERAVRWNPDIVQCLHPEELGLCERYVNCSSRFIDLVVAMTHYIGSNQTVVSVSFSETRLVVVLRSGAVGTVSCSAGAEEAQVMTPAAVHDTR